MYFLEVYILGIIQHIPCFAQLLGLSIFIVRFIHVVAYVNSSFFLLSYSIPLSVYTKHIYPFNCWQSFGLFSFCADTNKAAMKICCASCCIYKCICFSLPNPRSGMTESYVRYMISLYVIAFLKDFVFQIDYAI